MCKKTLTWFLTVTMVLTMFAAAPLPASAGVDGDWLYSLYDDGTTAAITGYIGTDLEINIPSTVAGKPVTRIASNAFLDKVSITSVTIPDSVLRIESGAFQNSALAAVDLGQGVYYIGRHAFYGTNLTTLSIPNSVETIDYAAFADCSALSDITIVGNNLDTLGQGAFSGTAITEISIPTSLSIIDDITFQYCTALTSVTIPANIMNIGYSAFNGCTALTSAVFEGDAPVMENFVFSSVHDDFTVYFHTGAAGFTTPTWSVGLMDYPCVEIGAPDTIAPSLTAGEVNRISDTEASVKFTSNEAGYYYYMVVEDGAGEPSIDTGGVGTGCDTTGQTIMLNALTAGAKDIYIVVRDAAGNVSEKLKLDIEAYQDLTEPLFGGAGTETDPYLISTEDDLFEFAQAANSGDDFTGQYFIQTADISLTQNWIPLDSFNGSYDGQNHVIEGLTVDAPGSDNIGFFGTAGSNAVLENIQLDNVNISGAHKVGALVGCSIQSNISGCSASGNIAGSIFVGGLIGTLQGGSLNRSFSLCFVSGTENCIGGLIGQVDAANDFVTSIENCYAISDVSGEADNAVGGLIGANYWGTLTNSYSAGTVNGSGDNVGGLTGMIYDGTQTISSYYDSDVAGLSDMGKGIPKTTPEMKHAATYEGWEFPGTWTINNTDNNGYPALAWQGFEHQAPEPDATLTGLSASGITLTPEFESATTSYSANVSNSVAGTTITAEPSESLASVWINDTEGTSKEVALAVGENAVTIVVTAADGITTETYTIVINRAAATSSVSTGGSSYTPPAIVVAAAEADDATTVKTVVSAQNTSATASSTISTAIIDALLDKAAAVEGTSKGDIIEVEMNIQGDIERIEFNVPQSGLTKIANDTDAGFAITSPFVSITFDGEAIETISGAAAGGNITIYAGIVDNSDLSEEDQIIAGGRPVYDLWVINEDIQVSNFDEGQAAVRIPYTLKPGEDPNAVVIYYLGDGGTLKTVRGHFDAAAGAVVFKTTHFSNFVIGHNPVTFSDIKAEAWYKDAVDFISARGITSGTGNNNYSPEMQLTRGQFMVLLMNAYQIDPANGDFTNNFADAGNTYYTNYLAAAKSLGIANGVGNNMFAPDKEITRQEMFVLLYNALKLIDELPAATNGKQLGIFNDAGLVAPWANEAMSALVQSDIVSGSDNMLSPAETTTRAQVAQVLYNLLAI